LALGESLGVVQKSGASYSFTQKDGEKVALGRGYDASRTYLRENKKVANEILKAISKELEHSTTGVSSAKSEEASEE